MMIMIIFFALILQSLPDRKKGLNKKVLLCEMELEHKYSLTCVPVEKKAIQKKEKVRRRGKPNKFHKQLALRLMNYLA